MKFKPANVPLIFNKLQIRDISVKLSKCGIKLCFFRLNNINEFLYIFYKATTSLEFTCGFINNMHII